jgi:hypothetical protein
VNSPIVNENNMSIRLLALTVLTTFATLVVVSRDHFGANAGSDFIADPLQRLMQSVRDQNEVNPGLFDYKDVEDFMNNQGPVAAHRFLKQRSDRSRRAARLANKVLKWRKALQLNHVSASSFPCDLFTMGLIFEFGRAHAPTPTGEYIETNPVIWIRLGALGGIIKQLELPTPERLVSYAVNAPRAALRRARESVSSFRQRHHRVSRGEQRRLRHASRGSVFRDLSVSANATLMHVLRAIAWWLDNWARSHPRTQATLVLDFENTDFAFASWSASEFFVQLDDMFPNLFDRIIGFRYKAKLWSLSSPISMLNRIFKSRFSSSPETDRKLRFVDEPAKISAYMPRVDENGYTMLPEHVSGVCMGPDHSKAPQGCQPEATASPLFEPSLWRAIYNEFYHNCTPIERRSS